MCRFSQPIVGGNAVMYWCELQLCPCDFDNGDAEECPFFRRDYDDMWPDAIEEVSLEELAEMEDNDV